MKKFNYYIFIMVLFFFSCQKNRENPTVEIEKKEKSGDEYSDTMETISKEQIMGQFDPSEHPDYELIKPEYADDSNMYIHKEAYVAFKEMHAAASASDVQLIIRSATRNFDRQKQIWEAKWSGKRLVQNKENLAQSTPDHKLRAQKILRWSSMPGTSRHHWGTDIDLNAFENSYFESGQGLVLYNWLLKHASEYGFCQPYNEKGPGRPHGYNEEKWHWSYIPAAEKFLNSAQINLNNQDISGFLGSETAASIDVTNKYIFGINKKCKN